MTTLYDVAQQLGISKATVSRAFSRPDAVKEETRELIMETARNLGYVPSRTARSLATGRHGQIGLFVPDIANPVHPLTVKAAQAIARRHEMTVMLADRDAESQSDCHAVTALGRQADGMILFQPQMTDDELRQIATGIPIVLVNRIVEGIPALVSSAREAMVEVVDHLADLGHRKVAYIGVNQDTLSARERHDALVDALQSRNMDLTELPCQPPQLVGGQAAVEDVRTSSATAVVCYNDLIALGLVGVLDAADRARAEAISVVGYDDIWAVQIIQPALTTVHLPVAEITGRAMGLLMAMIGGEDVPTEPVHVPCHLVVRGSTKPRP
ncbi:LacI family DNA-binding transcriptional regulator [Pseudarthrobacter phenanthrenivorans]|uniref:LacI family DNA-binding transcriptional regulator n=1 Tax=Pseudarthrobacter phenanthrenivorans TaxID=361575 RepID=UPI002F34FEE5